MSIVALSGTPRVKTSASAQIIRRLEATLGEPVPTYQATRLIRARDPGPALAEIVGAEAVLVVFPLYVDALPAPLVRALTLLEQTPRAATVPRVYAVVNCGFIEAENTGLALDMVAHFCERIGWAWQYGVGIGAGEYLTTLPYDTVRGPAARVFATLDDLANAVRTGAPPRENVLVAPRIPRALYTLAAHQGWRRQAKAYHTTDLMARPYARG
ncbi:MAG: hypothetical protein FWC46_00245 [Actinomycetia bacterium]|nr:hypothetical protein [Actinomycetes bacterium]